VTRQVSQGSESGSSIATYIRLLARESRIWMIATLAASSTYLVSRYLGAWAAALVTGVWIVAVERWMSRLLANYRGTIEYYRHLASIDDLTGLANDRSFRADLQAELTRADGPRPVLTLALLDIDQFKAYNDSLGHPAGDAALKEFGRTLFESTGGTFPIYRLGGDEFAVILRNLDEQMGCEVAERMRAAVEGHPWPGRQITVTLGLATLDRVNQEDDPSTLVERADRALYRAKRDGGNKVSFDGDEEVAPI
jgi:two-component system cell cycle response regulator